MKKILLALLFLSTTVKIFGQQFSQYNTGTLYDSFENPSQKAFITDSSKQYALNFLVPNFSADLFVTGNAQATLKSRAFDYKYDNSALQIGQGKYNHLGGNVNAYLVMFKYFSSLNGDVELGFSAQVKMELKGTFSDETAALLGGTQDFKNSIYSDIFNSRYSFQSYHQFGFTYKEKINKQFTLGAKLSILGGIQYEEMNVYHSDVQFNQPDQATIGLSGTYFSNYIPGHLSPRDYLPTFRNPGAAITLGGTYRTEDGFIIQGNVKDLGFIHWSGRSYSYPFQGVQEIDGLSTKDREKNIYNAVYKIITTNGIKGSFTTPIDGRGELSVHHEYFIDDSKNFKYAPTLIASKELFYPGFTGALVNPVIYKNKYSLTLTTTYDDMKLFNVGLQFMYKTPDLDFFIGSDRLAQSVSLASAAANKASAQTFQNSGFSGGNFFLGFALKIGPVIEHPMNASTIPTGEKGFLGRLWGRLFKTND
ncbi:MAG TPA: DUF5723 family protein [Mucilaginibacter sp.]